MRYIACVIALLASTLTAQAQSPVIGRQLAAGNFVCNDANNRYTYTIPAGYTAERPFTVVKLQIWYGLDYGSWSDFVGFVWRWSDGSYMGDGSHDDYRNGGPERIYTQDWGGNVYTFLTGDQIVMDFSCSPGVTPGHRGAMGVWIWFRAN